MQVLSITPTAGQNGGPSGYVPWDEVPAGGDFGAILADATTANWVFKGRATWGIPNPFGTVFYSAPAVPGGARIALVQPRVSLGMGSAGTGVASVNIDDSTQGGPTGEFYLVTIRDNFFHDVTAPAQSANRVGSDWTAQDLGNTVIYLTGGDPYGGGQSDIFVNSITLDIYYMRQGSVTVTPLPASVTTTTKPTISWTPSAPDQPSNPQRGVYVHVYTADVYSAAGFDPLDVNDYPPVYFSDLTDVDPENDPSARSHPIQNPLPQSVPLRAYVLVDQPWSGSNQDGWFSFGYTQFQIDLPPIGRPSFTATAFDSLAYVRLDVTNYPYAGGDPWVAAGSEFSYQVQRSVDGGATWTDVPLPSAFSVNPHAGGVAAIIYDRAAPRGTTLAYRIRATTHVDSLGDNVSLWTDPVVTALNITSAWLKCPQDPSMDMQVKHVPPFRPSENMPAAVFDDVIGYRPAFAMTDGTSKAFDFDVVVQVDGDAQLTALQKLLRSRKILLFQDTVGRQWYLMVNGKVSYDLLRANPVLGSLYPIRSFHTVTIPCVEVGAPTVI